MACVSVPRDRGGGLAEIPPSPPSLTTSPSLYSPIPASPATNSRSPRSAAFGTNRSEPGGQDCTTCGPSAPPKMGMGGQETAGAATVTRHAFPGASALPSQDSNPSTYNSCVRDSCVVREACPVSRGWNSPIAQETGGVLSPGKCRAKDPACVAEEVCKSCPLFRCSILSASLRFTQPGPLARSLGRGVGRDAAAAAGEELAGTATRSFLPSFLCVGVSSLPALGQDTQPPPTPPDPLVPVGCPGSCPGMGLPLVEDLGSG